MQSLPLDGRVVDRRVVAAGAWLSTSVEQHRRLVGDAAAARERDVAGRRVRLPVVLPERAGEVDRRECVGRQRHQS